jgi:hypothetical protein
MLVPAHPWNRVDLSAHKPAPGSDSPPLRAAEDQDREDHRDTAKHLKEQFWGAGLLARRRIRRRARGAQCLLLDDEVQHAIVQFLTASGTH